MRRLTPFRRIRRRHSPALTALALVALLLLLVMPTTGRLLGKLGTDAPHAGHGALLADASTATRHMVGHAGAPGHAQHPATPDHADGHAGGHADHGSCPYCPLLGSVVAWSPGVALLAVLPAARPARLTRRLSYTTAPAHGLGARGPPVLL